MKGKSKLILINVSFTAIINIILNFIFVPLCGITGAGFSTMISLIILNFLFLFQSYKNLSIIPFRRKMFKITLILILSTALLLLVKFFIKSDLLSLVFGGIFFISIYILLVLITGCLDKNDWYILKSVFRKLKLNRG